MSTPTVDINRVKLGRLKEHFDDDGASTPEAVARVIKGKPENVQFLRAYVEAAASEMGTPEILVQFDAATTAGTAPVDTPPEAVVSTPPEDPSTVIESVPEEVVKMAAEVRTAASQSPGKAEAAEAFQERLARPLTEGDKAMQKELGNIPLLLRDTAPLEYRFKDENGLSHILVEVHRKGNVVVLGNKPTDEMVTIQLNGAPVEVSLTHLRTLPAGNDFNLNGRNYTVATLLVIAEAAKV